MGSRDMAGHRRRFLRIAALACWATALPARAGRRLDAVQAAAVVRHYAAVVHANYADTLNGALALQAATLSFASNPSRQGLEQARDAWRSAREWYGQTEAFRFYGGPIDDARGIENRLNAWPVDEAYIDAVRGRADAGLINDRRIPISKATLVRHNERGGHENVATGWHAIEFLLWGQDFSDSGAGDRSFEDFVDGKALNADRRRQYLTAATALLVDDLRTLAAAWRPATRDNYRARFELGGMESLRMMIIGIGTLSRGELAGERLEVALNTQDQEDEQSCFSDNTHRDVVNNALGIENVWLGRYLTRAGFLLRGPSLRDLVAAREPAVAEEVTRHIAGSVAAAWAIQPPFDREIVNDEQRGGVPRIQAVIDSLSAQAKALGAAAGALGIMRLNMGKR